LISLPKGKTGKTLIQRQKYCINTKTFELIQMDLFGLSRIKNIGIHFYALVLGDFSRFTWTFVLTSNNEAFKAFKRFAKVIQNEKDLKIKSLRSDNGRVFQNESFESFVKNNVISHNFSAPRTPQQKGGKEK